MKAEDNLPDSSIGEGMDISIQGANGHVKRHDTGDTTSLKSNTSANGGNGTVRSASAAGRPMDQLALPDMDEKLGYSSDVSIGHGMDISIRGEGDTSGTKDSCDDGWGMNGNGAMKQCHSQDKIQCDQTSLNEHSTAEPEEDEIVFEGKNVEEVICDPVDDVVVMDCCPLICYRVCPCCIGDPDSPFWQLWYKHRLQVSRYDG